MLYPKKARPDPGDITELRILRMDEQREMTQDLHSNLKKYSNMLESLVFFQKKIIDDLKKLYTHDSVYSPFIHKLEKFSQYKSDIVNREIKTLRDALKQHEKVNTLYTPLKSYFKTYFDSKDKLKHYKRKVPILENKMEGKKKIKGQLTSKELNKLTRNQSKFKNAVEDVEGARKHIEIETNKINLSRFDSVNDVVKNYLDTEIAVIGLMEEKLGDLDDYEKVLAEKETEEFNKHYFLDVRKESKVRMVKNRDKRKGSSSDEEPVKQNIQNNYYYVNHGDKDEENNYQTNREDEDKPLPIGNGETEEEEKGGFLSWFGGGTKEKKE